jgi:putative acetyltransferase
VTIAVRPERAGDEAAIATVIEAAFRKRPHSDGSEAAIVERLRSDGDLALSLVAESGPASIVGHVAFSRVTITDGSEGWFGLGPVSVVPSRQNRGIGTQLIGAGFAAIGRLGARGCVVLGAPAYYRRFGFAHDPALCFPGPPPAYFQRRVLAGEPPRGVVAYAPAFG